MERLQEVRAAAAAQPLTALLVTLGTFNIAIGLWAVAAPQSFARALVPFGPVNEHLVHDYAAASLTAGAALVVAGLRPAWRVPLLCVALLWSALHAASHAVAAVRQPDPGPVVEAFLTAAAAGILAVALRASVAGRKS